LTTHRLQVGRHGESLAANALQRSGHQIVARNVRTPFGEIDIVARRPGELALVEVRTKQAAGFVPEASLDAAKRRRMRSAALWYVEHTGERGDWSIDLVAIELGADGRVARLEHYRAIDCE
jgi:putative endonuclease